MQICSQIKVGGKTNRELKKQFHTSSPVWYKTVVLNGVKLPSVPAFATPLIVKVFDDNRLVRVGSGGVFQGQVRIQAGDESICSFVQNSTELPGKPPKWVHLVDLNNEPVETQLLLNVSFLPTKAGEAPANQCPSIKPLMTPRCAVRC